MKQCFGEGSYATQSVNIEEFNSRGTGYGDDHVNAMSLFFGDDGIFCQIQWKLQKMYKFLHS